MQQLREERRNPKLLGDHRHSEKTPRTKLALVASRLLIE
jgi:hypothetical protein